VKQLIIDMFEREGVLLNALTYVFVTDEYLLSLNKSFLKHDYYTDVITFDLSETKAAVVGEVYISVPRVRENARSENVAVASELLRVVLHGALHLCGYKDKTKSEITKMREKENEYLRLFEEH
jgi:rRNA maturation RNase YbeY